MKENVFLSVVSVAAAMTLCGKDASQADLLRRSRCRAEVVALEERRNALKESIRSQHSTVETLTVVAELMEGVRKHPPAEREQEKKVAAFESNAPKTVRKGASERSACVRQWVSLKEGCRYRFRAEVKSEGVENADVKFGLVVNLPSGDRLWPAATIGSGTFEWRTVSFDFSAPAGVASALLMYGLESGMGTVSFRNVEVLEMTRTFE